MSTEGPAAFTLGLEQEDVVLIVVRAYAAAPGSVAGHDVVKAPVGHESEVFQQIRDEGVKPGITLRPSTDLETIEDTLNEVDLVLVMSVEPGFSGQAFIPEMMDRISKVREWVDKMGKTRPEISVDGDVKLYNAREVISAGANIVVSGSGVFGTSDPVYTMKEFAALT